MKNRIGFFEEEDGKLSYQRLQSFVLLGLFVVVTCWEIFYNQINFEVLVLLSVAATAPKLIQKFAEKKGVIK